MIQFNLLPDVKKEYIKAKRTKRLIMTASVLAAGASLAVVILLYGLVQVAQKKNIEDLTDDINSEISKVEKIEDLDKILTIQSQLETLPQLHQEKPEASRIFGYLYQLTPAAVKIRSIDVDFINSKMTITGSADTLATVNQFADTLKFASYKTEDTEDGKPFEGVTTDLRRNETGASYSIVMEFDPVLFDNTQEVTLLVPAQVTTRSIVGKPGLNDEGNSLFENNPEEVIE